MGSGIAGEPSPAHEPGLLLHSDVHHAAPCFVSPNRLRVCVGGMPGGPLSASEEWGTGWALLIPGGGQVLV